jgi:hypothetical protein
MSEIKEKVIAAIRNLPESATYEDIFEILFVQEEIAKALDDSEHGRFISQEEFEAKYNAKISKK